MRSRTTAALAFAGGVCLGVALLAGGACAPNGGGAATPTPVPTYPGAAALADAQRQAAGGQLADASDSLAEALRQVEEASPLRIENLVIAEAAVGYGLYKERSSPSFQPGEPIFLYMEPYGMARKREGDLYGIELVFDVAVIDGAGAELERKKDFLKLEVPSRRPNREIYATMKLHFGNYPPGSYVIEVVAHDKVGGEDAVQRIPFRIERAK